MDVKALVRDLSVFGARAPLRDPQCGTAAAGVSVTIAASAVPMPKPRVSANGVSV